MRYYFGFPVKSIEPNGVGPLQLLEQIRGSFLCRQASGEHTVRRGSGSILPHTPPPCTHLHPHFASTQTGVSTAAGGLDPISQCEAKRMHDWWRTLGEQTRSLGAKWSLAQGQRVREAVRLGASSSTRQHAMPFLPLTTPALSVIENCSVSSTVTSKAQSCPDSKVSFESRGCHSHRPWTDHPLHVRRKD